MIARFMRIAIKYHAPTHGTVAETKDVTKTRV